MAERSGFLSTVPAGRADVRLVLVVVLASLAVFLGAAPFAKTQLPAIPAFLPAYQSALVITDVITAVMLYGQFAIMRTRSLLVLAASYLFCAFMAIAHALSFPGLFSEAGLLGSGPQTTAWLYFLWHGAFPLLILAYAMLRPTDGSEERRVRDPQAAILASVAVVLAAVCGLVLLATAGQGLLPPIMSGNLDNHTKIYVASGTWALSVVALATLWVRRQRTVLDLWLMVVMCVWIFDVALAAVLNHGRFDLGWYAGRVYGLLAVSFVLMMLLVEHAVLYARLIASRENELREFHRAEEKAAALVAANKDLEAFSYSVSHDLRAPLRSIDGFSRVLQEDYDQKLDDAGRDCTARIRRATQRMAALIDDLLNLAQVSRANLNRAEVNLSALAREIVETLRERSPDRAAIVMIADVPPALGDSGLMRIVLDNLLGNAWKFTSNATPSQIEFGQRLVAGEPACYVRDNGAGFDMAYAGKLFQAFQRLHDSRDFPGTGIGLTIVHRIVTKHGGRIWAESEPGKGTTFYFTLPASEAAPAAAGPMRAAA